MAKIVLSSIGTTGDVKPFTHLGNKLKSQGHSVKAGSFDTFQEIFEKESVEFFAVGNPLKWDDVQDVFDRIYKAPNVFNEISIMIDEMIMRDFDIRYEKMKAELKGADLAVIHIADAAAQAAAEEVGVPWALVRFETTSIPTKYQSAPPVLKDLGTLANSLSWKIADFVLSRYDKILHRKLKQLNFSKWENVPVLVKHQSRVLNLCGCSSVLSPKFDDFPKNFVVTGQWLNEVQSTFKEADILEWAQKNKEDFAIVTLGSMGGSRGKELAELFANSFNKLGIKAIIQKGFAGIYSEEMESDSIKFCDYVPHELIIPLSKFAIHHAGSGTAHSILRFKKPSICIPHILDQEFFSMRLEDLKCSPGYLTNKKLRQDRFVKLLQEMTENYPSYWANAQKYGEIIQNEAGLENAVTAINTTLGAV